MNDTFNMTEATSEDSEESCVRQRRDLLLLLASLVLVSLLVWLPLTSRASFYGDDLSLLRGQSLHMASSSLWQALTECLYYKYRPVTSLLFYATYQLFGENFFAHILTNVVLFGVCAFLLARLIYITYPRQFWLSFSAGLCLVGSRFAMYHCTQRMGLMEVTAVLLLLLIVTFVHRAFMLGSRWSLWWANLFLLLLVFTHERFVVLCPVVGLAAWLASPVTSSRGTKVRLLCASLLIGVSNYVIKTYVLRTPFLIGTMTIPIEFEPLQLCRFLGFGLLNMIGFNIGQPHLSAFDFRFVHLGYVPGVITVLGVASIVGIWVRRSWPFDQKSRSLVLVVLAAILALVASASVTVRQEFRWLLPPYIIVLAGLAVVVTRNRACKASHALVVLWSLFVVASLWNDAWYRYHISNVYLTGWLTESRAERTLADAFAPLIRNGRQLYFINGQASPGVYQQFAGASISQVRSMGPGDLSSLTLDDVKQSLLFVMSDGSWHYLPSQNILACLNDNEKVLTPGICVANPKLGDQLRSHNWYFTLQAAESIVPLDIKTGERLLRQSISFLQGRCGNPYPYYALGRALESQHRNAEAYDAFKTAVECAGADENPAFATGMKRTATAENADPKR